MLRSALIIARREAAAYFLSPLAYFVIGAFLLVAEFSFFDFVARFNSALLKMAARPVAAPDWGLSLNQWVIEGYFQMLLSLLLFIVPLLTMRSIAEERQQGTFELLITAPLSSAAIVLGKFLGVALVLLVMLGLSSLLPGFLFLTGAVELGPVLTGLAGLVLCAWGFAALGLAVSAATGSQLIAGVGTMLALLALALLETAADPGGGGNKLTLLIYLSPLAHARELIQGVVSLAALVYFASLTVIGLLAAQLFLELPRWRAAARRPGRLP